MMRQIPSCTVVLLLALGWAARARAQESPKEPPTTAEAKSSETKPPENPTPKEESSVTEHSSRVSGQSIPYKATASTTLLKNEKGEPTALVYSTAYTRSDVKDLSSRPIAFIYNGGPGSASVWLHMGAFGPRRVVTENAAATPPAPYKIVDNEYSLLDKADLVFIDLDSQFLKDSGGPAASVKGVRAEIEMKACGDLGFGTSAQLSCLLEHGNGLPLLCQKSCCGYSSNSTTDDCNCHVSCPFRPFSKAKTRQPPGL